MDHIFDNERPIYIQLVEKIRLEIISGKLKSGERIPAVRELALTARVNPNTMQKALVELENEGLVYTERTNGKFVTDNKELIEKIKKELAKEKVNNSPTFYVNVNTLINQIEDDVNIDEETHDKLLDAVNSINSGMTKKDKWKYAKEICRFLLDKGMDICIAYLPQIIAMINK